MRQTIAKAFGMLPKRLQRRWLMLAPVAAVSAVLEMIGTFGVLVLVRLIADPHGEEANRALVELGRWSGVDDLGRATVLFAVGLGLYYAFKNLMRLGEAYVQSRCAGKTTVYLASGLIDRYLRAPYSLHLKRNSADLTRLTADAANGVALVTLGSVIALLSEVLVVLGMLAVLVWHTPASALIAAALLGLVLALLTWLTQSTHTRWGKLLLAISVEHFKTLQQNFAGAKEIQTLGRQRFFVSAYEQLRDREQLIVARRQALAWAPRLAVETLFVAGLALLFVVARSSAASSAETTATLGVLAYAGLRLLPSLHLIVYRVNLIHEGQAHVDAVYQDWTELQPYVNDGRPDPAPMPLRETLSFRNIGFRYEGANRDALSDISLEIRAGESVGFVGETGAGKSTLADLALGLLTPTCGSISIDGTALLGHEREWQRSIGYVPQAPQLLDDTLTRNIALGLADDEVDRRLLDQAIQAAQLQDFVSRLPQGLDTTVGERGARISGGERQRIAVARALYRDPSILIFDEATASLDNQTEKSLTDTVESLRGKKTLLVIAHRLTTVENCDRIVFLSQGKILDVGSFADLAERNERFRLLARIED